MIFLGLAALIIARAWVIWGADVISRSRIRKQKLKEALSPYVNEPFSPLPESWSYESAASYVAAAAVSFYLVFYFIGRNLEWKPNTDISSTVNTAFTAFALLYVFVFAKHSIKQKAVIVSVFGFFAAVAVAGRLLDKPFFDSQIPVFIILFSIIILVYDIKPERMLRYWFFLMLAITVVTIALNLAGVIESGDITALKSRNKESAFLSTRYALGFFHPNVAGMVLAQLFAMYAVIRRGKPKWFDFAAFAVIAAVIVVVIDSRGTELLLLVFTAALVLFGKLRSLLSFAPLKWLCILLPEIFGGLSIFAAYSYNPKNEIWMTLNGFTTGRIGLMNIAAEKLGVTLLGQTAKFSDSLGVDNSYVYMFFGYGVLFTVLMAVLYSLLIKRLWERKAVKELSLVLALVAYFAVETVMIDYANVTLWLMSSVILLDPMPRQLLFTEAKTESE